MAKSSHLQVQVEKDKEFGHEHYVKELQDSAHKYHLWKNKLPDKIFKMEYALQP